MFTFPITLMNTFSSGGTPPVGDPWEVVDLSLNGNRVYGWWDASDASTVQLEANPLIVDSWDGKSPDRAGYDMVSIGTPGTVWADKTQNGLGVIDIDGACIWVNNYYTPAADKWVFMMVMEFVGPPDNANAGMLWMDGSASGDFEFGTNSATELLGIAKCPGGGGSDQALTGGPFTGYQVVNFVFRKDLNTRDVWIGGVKRTTSTGFTNLSTRMVQMGFGNDIDGAPWDGGDRCPMRIGEIIMTEDQFDLDTQERMEGYLAHKWGIEDTLYAGHPHKEFAPVKAP